MITIGNPIGRSFKGTHGDGNLRFGHATNADWPTSDDEVGGFGYRGGGYYEIGLNYSEFRACLNLAFEPMPSKFCSARSRRREPSQS